MIGVSFTFIYAVASLRKNVRHSKNIKQGVSFHQIEQQKQLFILIIKHFNKTIFIIKHVLKTNYSSEGQMFISNR